MVICTWAWASPMGDGNESGLWTPWEGSVLDVEKGSPLRSDSGQEQGWEKTTRSSPIRVRS